MVAAREVALVRGSCVVAKSLTHRLPAPGDCLGYSPADIFLFCTDHGGYGAVDAVYQLSFWKKPWGLH